VIAEITVIPHVKFPTFVEDGAKAVLGPYRHIAEYKGNQIGSLLQAFLAARTLALITAGPKLLTSRR